MDTAGLHEILRNTTHVYRKGDSMVVDDRIPGVRVIHGYAMPSVEHLPPEEDAVDVHFIVVGVNRAAAVECRGVFLDVLRTYDDPERLTKGPSYIEAGGVVGDQQEALRMFALGKSLGLWDVILPAHFGFEGTEADDMAGRGFVMITGWTST